MYTISDAFIEELRRPVQSIRVRLEVLDTDENPVDGGVFYDVGYNSDATGILVDGSVDVDVTRAARRTFTASLLNRFGEWSPNSDWSGTFYIDRLIRIWRGVVYSSETSSAIGESEELVPIITAFIDHADVVVERNMSIVTLSGTDKWKKIAKSEFTTPTSYAANTPVNDVITAIANDAGITVLSLDPLANRHTDEKSLNKKLAFEIGDSRSDALSSLATSYGLDIYFDPMGILVSQDLLNPIDREVVFTYVA